MIAPDPDQSPYAVEARGLVKLFGDARAVDGIDLTVRRGRIHGVLGPNGAGKTTLLRMLLGIIDPDEGTRALLGAERPLKMARHIGYLPEERGLYPAMKAGEAIAFMGALRGLPLAEGRLRARDLMEEHGLGAAVNKPIRHLSKGMAQTVQILGTIVHQPRLIVLDEPFSGLDAINQGKLERLIQAQAEAGVTVLFSTHVIAHAERLCQEVSIIAGGQVRFTGSVAEARDQLRPQVRLSTKRRDGKWIMRLPEDTHIDGAMWHFALPEEGIEPLLKALIEADAGIETLAIERPSLHDAFIHIAGADAARLMGVGGEEGDVAGEEA